MKDFAENRALAGQRFKLRAAGPGADLGFGTYLWDDVVLLDSGVKVKASECVVIAAAHAPYTPMTITLSRVARTFEDAGPSLVQARHWIHEHETLTLLQVAAKPWNHGRYVAGRIRFKDKDLWLLLYETQFEPAPTASAA